MPAVPGPAIRQRAAHLRDVGKNAVIGMLRKQIGQIVPVLFETETRGRTPGYAPVTVAHPVTVGTIHPVRLTEIRDEVLGEVCMTDAGGTIQKKGWFRRFLGSDKPHAVEESS